MTDMTLIEFLTARLDEDEAAATAVNPLGETVDMAGDRHRETLGVERYSVEGVEGRTVSRWDIDATSFLRHLSPARVLAEVEAKRQLINRVEQHAEFVDAVRETDGLRYDRVVLRLLAPLALPYADHPDYDEEAWRP